MAEDKKKKPIEVPIIKERSKVSFRNVMNDHYGMFRHLCFVSTAIKCWRAAVGAWAVWAIKDVEEMAGVTVRGAMETPSRPGVHILLLCLSGTPSLEHMRAKIMVSHTGLVGEGGYFF